MSCCGKRHVLVWEMFLLLVEEFAHIHVLNVLHHPVQYIEYVNVCYPHELLDGCEL